MHLAQRTSVAPPRSLPTARSRQTTVKARALFSLPTLPFLGGKKVDKVAQREEAKAALLDRIAGLERGVKASDEDKADVERLASALEKLNPNLKPLEAPELTGKWRLLYTTSASILGISRPAFLRPSGPIFQTIDAGLLKARNNESWPFYNSVTADLTPVSVNKVKVQFRTFRIFNVLPIKAPEAAKGELAVTYLDESLRVSRGDRGNLFVLDMADSSARLTGQE